MVMIDINMPEECRDCPLSTYYPFTGQTRCRGTGEVLADNYKPIKFDGRSQACPLVDISDDRK